MTEDSKPKEQTEIEEEGSFHYSEDRDEILSEDLMIGRTLLERSPPKGYIQEWSKVISKAKEKKGLESYKSVLIFRIETEWLAIPIALIREVTEHQPVHVVPHKTDNTFRGIVNIRGELQLCFSLRHLVGLKVRELTEQEKIAKEKSSERTYKRMIVLKQGLATWVFSVDEIYGIHHYYSGDSQNAPVTVEKDTNTFTKEMIYWKGKHVGSLDAELMLYALKRKFQ
ncbi:MAG: chemotaxis protein CheW [Chlamydiales bacterium]|nr:chemotaxis protein CheW [Chlamydiales bacterium]NCF70304.1 chemotaxis protein CheW [Chlamydiales bacterium]